MGSFALRDTRAVLILAIVIVPWVVAPRSEVVSSEAAPSAPARATAIESFTWIEVVVSNRPTIVPRTASADSSHWPWAMPIGAAGRPPTRWLGEDMLSSGSLGWAEPMALHHAERGPPLLALLAAV